MLAVTEPHYPKGNLGRPAAGVERMLLIHQQWHPSHIVKNLIGYRKLRDRGLEKNTAQLHLLLALANVVIAK